MNKCSKPFFATVILAVFSVANAQQINAPAAVTAPAPAAVAPAAVAAPAQAEVVVPVAAPAVTAPAAVAAPAQAEVVVPVAEAVAPQVLNVEKPKVKKSKKKPEYAMVDFPANFEIQAKKIMPVDSESGDDNLDQWWGRANLAVETQSENFKGKVHLRMYPGDLATDTKTESTKRDQIQIYEAWAWHRGDYFNFKIGRWSNTTRFGSQTFGGYVDARKNSQTGNGSIMRREAGFMSTYYPENGLQLGFHNEAEDISLDLSLISMDNKLNKGDLRAHLRFDDLADVEGLNVGVGYRSNVFDEIYSKYGDVTHTVALGGNLPLLVDVGGLLKKMNLFVEAAIIGWNDRMGGSCLAKTDAKVNNKCRADNGESSAADKPILAGLEIDLYRSFDKIVIEAEYDNHRKNSDGTKEHVKDIMGSIYVKKQLNDRFTLNLGMQSENGTKDFSFAGRLQGRIN